jgi:hypothetical protein
MLFGIADHAQDDDHQRVRRALEDADHRVRYEDLRGLGRFRQVSDRRLLLQTFPRTFGVAAFDWLKSLATNRGGPMWYEADRYYRVLLRPRIERKQLDIITSQYSGDELIANLLRLIEESSNPIKRAGFSISAQPGAANRRHS